MPISNYSRFAQGVNIEGLPILNTYAGNVFWVDSAVGANLSKGTFGRPFATIDYAVGRCTANNGDLIMVKPGHTETVSAAAGLDLDVAGITIIFLGNDNDRGQINFTTAVGADMDVDAADITMINPRFVAGIDALTGPIDVNAARFKIINGLWEDAAGIDTTDCIVADANADDLLIDGWEYRPGDEAGTQKQSHIQIAAATRPILRNIKVTGDFATGIIENGTAWADALLENVTLDNANASPTVCVLLQATSTGSMKNCYFRVASGTTYVTAGNDMQFFESYGTGTDASAGEQVGTQLGGSIEAKIDVIDGFHDVPSADATANAQMRDSLGNKTDGSQTTVGTTRSLMGYAKGIIDGGWGAGIGSFPAAAAPANDVSQAAVMRYVNDNLNTLSLNFNATNYFTVTADFTSATWNTVAAHEVVTVTGACRVIILPRVTGTITSGGGTATLILGDETTTNSIIASTDAEQLADGEWWADTTTTRTVLTRTLINGLDIVIQGGKDIGYTIGTEALTGGSIEFLVWWQPLVTGSSCAAGAGGAL